MSLQRWLFAAGAVFCAALIGAALYFEHVMGLEPCPLCIFQRMFLMAMAAVESDPAKRTALYAEFQQIIADELPVYHINTLPYHTVYSDKIGNPPLGIWGTSTPIDKVYLKP